MHTHCMKFNRNFVGSVSEPSSVNQTGEGVKRRSAGSGIANSDPQNIWNPRKICGSFMDAISSEPQQITPTLLLLLLVLLNALSPFHWLQNTEIEWPFCVKFCFAPVALKPGFRSLATLKLVVNVVSELQTKSNSCGIARYPCDSMAFLLNTARILLVTTLLVGLRYGIDETQVRNSPSCWGESRST